MCNAWLNSVTAEPAAASSSPASCLSPASSPSWPCSAAAPFSSSLAVVEWRTGVPPPSRTC